MPAIRLSLALLATLGLSAPVLAQDKAKGLDDLDATRIGDNQVEIEFEYEGGACEEVGPAKLGEVSDGVLAVTFPTVSTAEVCTMQAVEIEVKQTIEVDPSVRELNVTLADPDGRVIGSEMTDIDDD